MWSASGELTAPVVAYDDTGTVDVYRIYIGMGDGRIQALQYTLGESTLASLWQSETGRVTQRDSDDLPTAHLLLSSDVGELIIGSGTGAFVLDAVNGTVLRRHTEYGSTAGRPAYADAAGTLWTASGSVVYALGANGSVCSYDAGCEHLMVAVTENDSCSVQP